MVVNVMGADCDLVIIVEVAVRKVTGFVREVRAPMDGEDA